MWGYDLEDPNVIAAYNKVLLDYGFESKSIDGYSEQEYSSRTLFAALKKCEEQNRLAADNQDSRGVVQKTREEGR